MAKCQSTGESNMNYNTVTPQSTRQPLKMIIKINITDIERFLRHYSICLGKKVANTIILLIWPYFFVKENKCRYRKKKLMGGENDRFFSLLSFLFEFLFSTKRIHNQKNVIKLVDFGNKMLFKFLTILCRTLT